MTRLFDPEDKEERTLHYERLRRILTSDTKPSNPKDAIGVDKVSLSVIPANVLLETAVALTEGALKYRRHNYRVIGVHASVYYDAAMRHLMSWWEGQDIDEDSGLNHIVKAITALIVLRDGMSHPDYQDDRPPKNGDIGRFIKELNDKTRALRAKYPKAEPAYTQGTVPPE